MLHDISPIQLLKRFYHCCRDFRRGNNIISFSDDDFTASNNMKLRDEDVVSQPHLLIISRSEQYSIRLLFMFVLSLTYRSVNRVRIFLKY